MTTYYSQNDEERFILEFFKGVTNGRLLDVGAFDGVQMSNTRRLIELGWSGVLVEPAPHVFIRLLQNCDQFNDRLVFLQGAVCATRKLARLWMDSTKNREWSNTISSALLEAGSVLEPIGQNVQLMTCTMADLQAFGPYDFVSIDAEWEDMEILKVIPEEMLRSWKLLSIEPREGQSDEMTALLIKRGMKQVYRTPENILCAQA